MTRRAPANPGLITARILPEGNAPVTQHYDAAGRVISQTDAAGHTSTLDVELDGADTITLMTDPLDNTMRHAYGPTGELLALTDEAGETIAVSVDDARRRNRITDRLGHTTAIAYDPDTGLPTRIEHPDNPGDQFAYTTRTL
jgi:YD repeat-containing protein